MAQLSAQLSTTAFNTTDVPLGPGGTFVPTQFEDVSSWNTVTVAVVADAPSAASGLVFQWSADGVTVDIAIPYDVIANVPRIFDSAILMKFFRVIYTNGGFAQTRFNILTVYRYSSSVVIRDIQDGEGDSIMDAAQNAARVVTPNGGDVAMGSTTDAAAQGDVNGTVNAHLRGIDKQLYAGSGSNNTLSITVPAGQYVWDSQFPGWLNVKAFGDAFTENSESAILYAPGAGLWLVTGRKEVNGGAIPSERARTPHIFKPLNAVAINPAASIWTPTTGYKFRLMGYHLQCSITGNVLLKDGAGGTVIAVVPCIAGNDGVYVSLGNGKLSAANNNILEALGPAASTLSGIVFGIEE